MINIVLLKEHGYDIENNNNNPSSASTIKRRLQSVDLCFNAINNNTDDSVNIEERYISKRYKVNPEVFDVIKPKIELLWIKEQNNLVRELAKDNDRRKYIYLTTVCKLSDLIGYLSYAVKFICIHLFIAFMLQFITFILQIIT